MFSGSGSFGIECSSRGAKKVIFFENYQPAINILEKNIKSIKKTENSQIFKNDCFNFFKSDQNINHKFDVIFIDPPYKETKINEIIEKIIEKNLLKKEGVIIIHRHKKDNIELTKQVNIFEDRVYGLSKIYFGN